MDVHALGSLLDDRREGNSSCYKPLFPTGGQRLPCRGCDVVMTSFLPCPFALSKRWWAQAPKPAKNFTHAFVWLLSSNQEASLRGHEQLKDQTAGMQKEKMLQKSKDKNKRSEILMLNITNIMKSKNGVMALNPAGINPLLSQSFEKKTIDSNRVGSMKNVA